MLKGITEIDATNVELAMQLNEEKLQSVFPAALHCSRLKKKHFSLTRICVIKLLHY